MRFALLEAKIALIELMKRFSFVKTEETEVSKLLSGCPLCIVFAYFFFRTHWSWSWV